MTSTTKLPKVVVSLLNWNGGQKFVDFVHSLQQIDYADFEIVVVDNASADDSVKLIQAAYPTLKIIVSEKNLGYAGGNRLALEYALQSDAELFWILNYDLTCEPDVLSKLVDAYLRHGAALYGSISVSQRGKNSNWGIERDFFGYKSNKSLNVDQPILEKGQDPNGLLISLGEILMVANLNGNSLLVPLDVVRQHGFMNESFFLYYEEWEYCLRLAREQIPSLLVLNSMVYHEVSGSWRHETKLSAMMNYYHVRNNLWVMKRYADRADYLKRIRRYIRLMLVTVLDWLKGQILARRFKPFPVKVGYMLLGMIHGQANRLGIRFLPEKYR